MENKTKLVNNEGCSKVGTQTLENDCKTLMFVQRLNIALLF